MKDMQQPYGNNYKTLLKDTEKDLNKWRPEYIMLEGSLTLCKDSSSPQINAGY